METEMLPIYQVFRTVQVCESRSAPMFIDARSVPTGTVVETELCIIGGGLRELPDSKQGRGD
jgi:hypothetical protein